MKKLGRLRMEGGIEKQLWRKLLLVKRQRSSKNVDSITLATVNINESVDSLIQKRTAKIMIVNLKNVVTDTLRDVSG